MGSTLVQLPDGPTLHSALDTLPHNANLHLWGRRGSNNCPLCEERQTLIHVLNNYVSSGSESQEVQQPA